MFDYKQELKNFPETFGVYIMKNINDEIIYIGKANNLKQRVNQYFNGQDKRIKIESLRKQVERIEFIITASEMEALILENNLIKQNKPKFNTLLKDDKTYPYIEVTLYEDFPRLIISPVIKNNGSKYFGPFPDKKALNNIIDTLQKIYKLRTCNNLNKNGCLYYHMKTCSAPCKNLISKEMYIQGIGKCIDILSGKNSEIIKEFTEKMFEVAENLEFEKAQEYKNIIEDLKYIASKQRISSIKDIEEDVIVCEKVLDVAIIVLFEVRNGNIIGQKRFFMEEYLDENSEDIVSSFIKQYYYNLTYLPKNIILENKLIEQENIEKYLNSLRGTNVDIIIPQKGKHKKLLELAKQNLNIIALEYKNKEESKKKKETEGWNNLSNLLNINNLKRIESFDISHTSGSLAVASMVVFENGKPNKKAYRKFKLEIDQNDDYKSMQEVIRRRFTDEKLLETLPDVLFIDGGEGQVGAAKEVLEELNINIPIVGMVKDDSHNTKDLLFNGKELGLKKSSPEFKLVVNIQDETHNFAINYHKQLRSKNMIYSKLDDIKGIGEIKKKLLLEEFKTIENIKNASVEELCKIKGINEELAKNIKISL